MKRNLADTAGDPHSGATTLPTQETKATRLLRARNAEFAQEIIKVTDDVVTAVGYSVQPVSMIIGGDGIIIVDTGIDTASAERILHDFREITEKPVTCIILTHGHGDHTGGVPVFAGEGNPQIWARDSFGQESDTLKSVGMTINNVRGARQGGFRLPPNKRINNGVAQAYYPERGGKVFGSSEAVKPTHLLTDARKKIESAGVNLHPVAATGETHDAL